MTNTNITLNARNNLKFSKLQMVSYCLILLFVCYLIQPLLINSFVYQGFREANKAWMTFNTKSWGQISGSHFIVRYQRKDAKDAGMILDIAETSFQRVNEDFHFNPQGSILINIYPDSKSLGRSFGWAANETAMGAYWAGTIRLLSPIIWIPAGEDMKPILDKEGPVLHEYTHLVIDYLTRGNVPRWFTEGLAQYEEKRVNHYEMDHEKVTDENHFYDLKDMDLNFDNLRDQKLAYYESLSAVEYLMAQYGEENVNNILSDLGKGHSFEQALKNNVGISIGDFEHDFKSWVILKNK